MSKEPSPAELPTTKSSSTQSSQAKSSHVEPTQPESTPTEPVTFWQSLSSVFWAAFGVQKHALWQRDLERGSWPVFALAIILFLVVFIGGLVLVVRLALS